MHSEVVINQLVQQLLAQPQWQLGDRRYLINQVKMILMNKQFELADYSIDEIKACGALELAQILAKGLAHPWLTQAQVVGVLMNLWTPAPSVINTLFQQHYQHSPAAATAWFYELSKQSGYIAVHQLAANRYFTAPSDYGQLEVTINAVKPEKEPKAIAKAAAHSASTEVYPKCVLCVENEGFLGGNEQPVRSQHRLIELEVLGEGWSMQFSPYLYYEEHAIFISHEHRPMRTSPETFERLLAIVEHFPHYFVGANADLPIVGGSILSHDHYQGGAHTFALQQAPLRQKISFLGHGAVQAGIVQWPMPVIRLIHEKIAPLVAVATHILQRWREYSDVQANIVAFSIDGTLHQGITPIAYQREGLYYLDLVLRNNRTSSEHPDGIFHPHRDVHHIKKENIGLIEVMGLAILPGRLHRALAEIKRYLLGREVNLALEHRAWAYEIASSSSITVDNVDRELELALARRYLEVLNHAAVFKDNALGQRAFLRFIDVCNRR